MTSNIVENIYSNTHNVNIFADGLTNFKTISVDVNKKFAHIQVKIKDPNDPLFNFTANIDRLMFDKMKNDQNLDICFEEFHLQFLELLQQTLSRQMLLRLEQSTITCKMIFYEKSKIKSLIFLVIHLTLTDEKDIIKEMLLNINQLKELHQNANSQLQIATNQIKDKEILLNSALSANYHLEKQFLQSVKSIETASFQSLNKIEKRICSEIDNLNNRFNKIIKEIEKVKKENTYRENLYSQTVFQLEQFKKNNDKNCKMISSLNIETDILTSEKKHSEKIAMDLRQTVMKKDNDIEKLNEEIANLRRDIQEATIIIAQKTKTHDEIAKDLVQANVMIVNFNKQNSNMSKEVSYLKEIIKSKDQNLQEQLEQVKYVNEEFEKYKKENNPEDKTVLQQELWKCQRRIEELEKHNREAAKVNGLLTRRLAGGDR